MTEVSRTYRARWILPISSPPIENGWIQITGGVISELGRGQPPAPFHDLGDVAVMPGLVNAHTHLEFSDCEGPIGTPGMELADWIGMVVRQRGIRSDQEKQAAISRGLTESCESGATLLGEISTPPCAYQGTASNLIRIRSFSEVLGLSSARYEERLDAATNHLRDSGGVEFGISPHAPYSTSDAAIDACVGLAKQANVPIAMHVAESPAERELIQSGTGPFRDALERMGVWDSAAIVSSADWVLSLVHRLALAPSCLIIHGNDLKDFEIASIASHANVSVVYCPRTHHFFRHGRHPVAELMDAGINVALGTDSRASNPDLNVWREAQFLLNHRQDIEPIQVLRMLTANGAHALGFPGHGSLAVGNPAELGVCSTNADSLAGLYRDLAQQEYRSLAPA